MGKDQKHQPGRAVERLLTVLDSIDASVYIADLESYDLLYVNKYFTDIWGSNVTGKKCHEVIYNFSTPCRFCNNKYLLNADGKPSGMYNIERHRKSQDRWYDYRIRAISWVEGRMAKLSIATDITDKKLIELEREAALEKLRKSEEQMRSIIRTSPDGISITALDGTIRYVSDNLPAMHGCGSAEEMTGRSMFEFLDPSYHGKAKQLIGEMLKGNYTGVSEYRVLRKDGSSFFADINAEILKDREGNPESIFLIERDISGRKAIEKELIQNRELYENLMENSIDAVYLLSGEGRVLNVNRTACEMTLYTRDELLKLSIDDIDPNFPKDAFIRFWNDRPEGTTVLFETLHRSKDGTLIPVEVNGIFFIQDDSKYLFGVARDLTARKAAEKAIKDKTRLLENITDNLFDLVGLTDLEGNFKYVNAAAYKVPGYSRDQLIGKNVMEFIHPDDLEQVKTALSDALKNRVDNRKVEYKLNCADGSWIDLETLGKFITDDDGNITDLLFSSRDITEKNKLEHQKEEALEKLKKTRDILEQTSSLARVGGWETNLITGEVSWSAVKREIHEVSADFQPDINMTIDFYKEGESRNIIREAVRQSVENGMPYDVEVKLVTAKGNERWVRTKGSAEFKDGKCVRLFGTTQDIDESKKSEEEKERLKNQLAQAQKMESVGRLAGGVAHDFNNMLGVILGHAELAMENADPSLPLYADLEEIRKAARRSADLTRQLLAFARKQNVSPKVLDINEELKNMLKMIKRIIGEDISLKLRPGEDLWNVSMDPSQIDQIIANLCVNARDAISNTGTVTIETGNVTLDNSFFLINPDFAAGKPGDYCMISVSDTGCGMDKETQAKIFEPFFTTKEQGKGTGLGLSTVFGIVRQNNGMINVYSEPDHGTAFRIYLPRYYGELQADRKITVKEKNRRGSETILLVEDEASILDITKTILERQGYNVLAVSSPKDAENIAGSFSGRINLLITDVIMPEINGKDLADKISVFCPEIKILFMSGYTADVIAHHGVLHSDVNFIQKPFAVKDLSARVRDVLDK
jgi:two-component system, cell cycle sensor histidine kinase and response regulator CckA